MLFRSRLDVLSKSLFYVFQHPLIGNLGINPYFVHEDFQWLSGIARNGLLVECLFYLFLFRKFAFLVKEAALKERRFFAFAALFLFILGVFNKIFIYNILAFLIIVVPYMPKFIENLNLEILWKWLKGDVLR